MLPRCLSAALACLAFSAVQAEAPGTNAFDDPFGPATSAIADCPVPAGPRYTREQARTEAHWRAERGTSCHRSGRCRLPNAYLYDREIYPRVLRFVAQDGRFDDTSVWITVQRRWVFVQGCVRSRDQGLALEQAVRAVDDVEAVVGEWTVWPAAATPPSPP